MISKAIRSNLRTRAWARVALVLSSAALLGACATQQEARAKPENDFGVLVMAHGGPPQWNERVSAAVAPLRTQYPVVVAFGMADAESLQDGVTQLESQGAHRIGVVRLFVSGESWYERTQQILGLAPGAPPRPAPQAESAAASEHAHHHHHGGDDDDEHSMDLWRVDSQARFAMSEEGLADAPEVEAILAERATRLSRDPRLEDVLILAHGPGDDAENERWVAKISARAAAVRAARPFRRVEVLTLREDWPDKRVAAEQAMRRYVERAKAEGGRAVVIPFRVEGFGPYAKVLSGLDYVSDGTGLLPHPNVTQWIARQAQALRDGPLETQVGARR